MSSHFPKWTCKNSCVNDNGDRISLEPDCKTTTCPMCKGPLVRWMKYEVKQEGRSYSPRQNPRPVA